MVLEKLSESLKSTLKKIANSIFVDESLINELIKDIQRALLKADVNVQLVLNLSKNIKKRALEEQTPKGIDKKEHLVKIVYEELVNFLGKEAKPIHIAKKNPFKIMLVGLFGSGKTTTVGKLAKYYQQRGHKVAALGLDVHRPAATEQLKQICDKLKVPCFVDETAKDVLHVIKEYEKEFSKYDLLIIDTAGRDALSQDLIKELEQINKKLNPDERLLVISADLGQTAKTQADQFHKSVNITGIIATKMDGTSKAGGALTACAATQTNIKFIGTGEKYDDLETFDPQGFVSRLLGMGDLKSLLEKAEAVLDTDKAEDLSKKMLKGEFNFIDLYEQLQAMNKLGPLSKITELIPGFSSSNIPKDMLNVQEEKLKKWKIILQSMTKEELEDPELLSTTRLERIAKGSGTSIRDVRELLKQYRQSKKLLKMIKGNPENLMKKMKGKMPKGFGL